MQPINKLIIAVVLALMTARVMTMSISLTAIDITRYKYGMLERNGTNNVDAINIIRCIALQNLTGEILVGVCDQGVLNVVHEGDEESRARFDSLVARCYAATGYGISFGQRYNITDIEDLDVIGDVEESADITNYDRYDNVSRDTRMDAAGDLVNYTDAVNETYNSEFENYSRGRSKRTKYVVNYNMFVTEDKNGCNNHEQIYSATDECINYYSAYNGFWIYNPNGKVHYRT